jgi:hypothetical protein
VDEQVKNVVSPTSSAMFNMYKAPPLSPDSELKKEFKTSMQTVGEPDSRAVIALKRLQAEAIERVAMGDRD